MITRNDTYKIMDRISLKEKRALGFDDYEHPGSKIRAKWTGEIRKPKRGEWYLSGSIVEAYRAYSGMDQRVHIAKLVRL